MGLIVRICPLETPCFITMAQMMPFNHKKMEYINDDGARGAVRRCLELKQKNKSNVIVA
jgi:hypothetical protein